MAFLVHHYEEDAYYPQHLLSETVARGLTSDINICVYEMDA